MATDITNPLVMSVWDDDNQHWYLADEELDLWENVDSGETLPWRKLAQRNYRLDTAPHTTNEVVKKAKDGWLYNVVFEGCESPVPCAVRMIGGVRLLQEIRTGLLHDPLDHVVDVDRLVLVSSRVLRDYMENRIDPDQMLDWFRENPQPGVHPTEPLGVNR